jgi:hypothetical protein
MPFRLSDRCSILLNLRNLLSLFSSNLFSNKKGPRGFRRRSKSGRKRPGEGQRQRGWGSHRVSYFANPKAPRIDEAQFSARALRFCVATVRIAADHVGGGTDTLFQKECSDNPNRFRNKTTLRLRLRFSIESGYPEIEYD